MTAESPQRVPKIIGADVELGNAILGVSSRDGTSHHASRLLLRYIEGVSGYSDGFSRPSTAGYNASYMGVAGGWNTGYEAGQGAYVPAYNPSDIGRKWLANGSCCYIDLDHLEICLPEVTSAWDWTAAWQAQLRIVRNAQQRAAETLPPGRSLQVIASNSDGEGSAWGSHLNFLVSRRFYHQLFETRLHYLLWLASYQASSVIITGQGKVGAENGETAVDYQLSARADFFQEVVGPQTTFHRPLVNSRDEPLCTGGLYSRLHYIPCDSNLCDVANVLKVGILQIVLAMMEDESPLVDADLIFVDPVRANIAFSHDPTLETQMPALGGRSLTALEHQRRIFERAAAFVESGACNGTVPRAHDILALWAEVLDQLEARDWDALARRLDWVLKRMVIEGAIGSDPSLTWASPAAKHLDIMYANLDPGTGLFWSMQGEGFVEQLVAEEHILHRMRTPPSNTRAYTRGQLLRRVRANDIESIDWHRVGVRVRGRAAAWPVRVAVDLDDPTCFTRAHVGELFRRVDPLPIEDILDALGALAQTGAESSPARGAVTTTPAPRAIGPARPEMPN